MKTYQKRKQEETREERYQRIKIEEEKEQKENFQNLLDKIDEDDKNEPSKVAFIIDKIKYPEHIVYSLPNFDKTIYIQEVKLHSKYRTYYKFGKTVLPASKLGIEEFIEYIRPKYNIDLKSIKIKNLPSCDLKDSFLTIEDL